MNNTIYKILNENDLKVIDTIFNFFIYLGRLNVLNYIEAINEGLYTFNEDGPWSFSPKELIVKLNKIELNEELKEELYNYCKNKTHQ